MPGSLWIALVAGGFVAGLGLVAALCLPSGHEVVGGIASLVGLLLGGWAVAELISSYGAAHIAAISIAIGIGALVGGYSLASATLPQGARPPRPRQIAPATGNRTAVMLFSDAEKESYSPAETALELEALEEDGILRLGLFSTPFLFTASKARYRAIGGISPARRQVIEVLESLERALEGLGAEHLGVAWCSGTGNLLEQVDDLARAGYSRIAVVPLAVTESLEMIRTKSVVDQSRPSDAGIEISYGAALGSDDRLADLILRRIEVGLDEPATTGIVLVVHGQPEGREELNPDFDETEIAFANRVKTLVAERQVPLENVRIAWADWREVDITSTVRHLAALGCTRILVCPACFPVDGLSTLLDIPLSIRQARVDAVVSVVTLPPWRDEPELVEALRLKAVDALNELEPVAEPSV